MIGQEIPAWAFEVAKAAFYFLLLRRSLRLGGEVQEQRFQYGINLLHLK